MRIVSLLPSATEIVAHLGLREHLVGTSHECDFPAGIENLPVLTASILDSGLSPKAIDTAVHEARLESRPIYTVDGALLSDLRPDLVLTQGVCSVCAVTPETIRAGLKLAPLDELRESPGDFRLLSLAATTFEGVLRDILAVAAAAGIVATGERSVAALRRAWAELRALGPLPAPGANDPSRAPLRAFFLEWSDPPWHAGHWVPEQIAIAGGLDVFGEAGAPSRPLPWSEIAAADPDWIIAGACGFDLATNLRHARALLDRPIVGSLRAIREGRFWAVDANSYFSRPAPRMVQGAAILRAIFEGRGHDLPEGVALPVCAPRGCP